MTDKQTRDLSMIIWQQGVMPNGMITSDGKSLVVKQTGYRASNMPRFEGVEVSIDGSKTKGSVVFLPADDPRDLLPADTILCVSASPKEMQLDDNGRTIPLLEYTPPPSAMERFGQLLRCDAEYECGLYISSMQPHDRLSLFNTLYLERLKIKSDEVMELFGKCDKSWNSTLYTMLIRSFGDPGTREAYTMLSTRIPVEAILRENNSLQSIEALLLGTSGLLDVQHQDGYTIALIEEFEHLAAKYEIRKMSATQWQTSRRREHNQPVNRLATLAMLLHNHPYMFDNVMKCRQAEDIHRIFCVEASDYWSTRTSTNNAPSSNMPKRIGSSKAELLGINFVAIMQFTYGCYLNDEELKSGIVDLMEKIPAEVNRLIQNWCAAGVVIDNAYDAQAVLQLSKLYCANKRCDRCYVARRIIKHSINR